VHTVIAWTTGRKLTVLDIGIRHKVHEKGSVIQYKNGEFRFHERHEIS
jgi:hypothetical protein